VAIRVPWAARVAVLERDAMIEKDEIV